MSMQKSQILTLAAALATVTMAGGVTAAELAARQAHPLAAPARAVSAPAPAAAPVAHEIEVGDM